MTALGRVKVNGTQDTEAQKPSPWMVKMQSPRVQCCLCACCVMSAMLGMFMLSAGVCLVLNYNFLEVDTSGLPPNLHNEEGKKVVGIILICVGVFAVVLSGVISTLYFTACTHSHQARSSVGPGRAQHHATNGETKGAHGRPSSERGQRPSSRDGHHHPYKHLQGNGSTPGRSSPSLSGSRRAGAVPRGMPDPSTRSQAAVGKDGPSFSRSGMKSRSHASATSSRSHRRGKKGRHGQGRYKNPLAPHPEEAGIDSQSLSESRRSASSSRRMQGHVNYGADLEDELEMTQDSVASAASSGSSSVSRSVIIKVDPSEESGQQPSLSRRRSRHGQEEETRFTADPRGTADSEEKVSRLNLEDDEEDEDEEDDEDVSGRMSRSTMDSQDLSEDIVEEGHTSNKRLDRDILELLS